MLRRGQNLKCDRRKYSRSGRRRRGPVGPAGPRTERRDALRRR